MDRLSMLRQMAANKPDDPFVSYGLAMELGKQSLFEEAFATFADLVRRHPTYVAAYLMYGNLVAKHGEPAQARAIYDAGIAVAEAASDEHTASELNAAKAELG